ncbi:MAG: hypothetical protein MJ245_03440 [Clostridia bacterium]|nr:hypothetical protein [Clostridia bacterium]
MKKIYELLSLIIICLSLTFIAGCNMDIDVTYNDIYDNNKIENVLKKYDSYTYEFVNLVNEAHSYTLYFTQDEFSLERKEYVKVTLGNDDYYYDKKTKTFEKVYNVTDDTFRENHGIWSMIYNPKGSEKIVDAKQRGKKIYAEIKLEGEDAKKEIAYLTDKVLLDNQYVLFDVVLDKDTLLCEKFEEYIATDYDKTMIAYTDKLEYNCKQNKHIKKAYELNDESKTEKGNDDRLVTVYRNKNMADEKEFTFICPKGKMCLLYVGEEYDAYSDEECKVPYSFNNDLENDEVIYITDIKENK